MCLATGKQKLDLKLLKKLENVLCHITSLELG